MLLWIFLAGAGSLGLLACAGCGVGGYFLFFAGPKVAGQWDLTDPPLGGARVTLDLRRDGTGMIDGPGADVHFTYRFNAEKPMTLEWTITRIDSKQRVPVNQVGFLQPRLVGPRLPLFANQQNLVGVTERFRVTMKDDTLTLTPQNEGAALTFRRVR